MTIKLIYSNPRQPEAPKEQALAIGASREEQALMLINEGYQAFWNCPEEDQTVNRAVFIAKLRLFVNQGW